jgi:hypothetical protein
MPGTSTWELEAQEPAAGLQHPVRFGQRNVDMGDVPDAERNRVGIETVVGKRQVFCRANGETALGAGRFADRCAACAFAHHVFRDVGDRDVGAAATCACNTKGDVAGAAGHVQHLECPVRLRRVEQGDEVVLPKPVKTAGHQVVHLVIAGRHLGEHLVHQALAVIFCNRAETERGFALLVSLFMRPILRCTIDHSGDHGYQLQATR